MADYTHTIGILIAATDEATAVAAAASAKIEEQQAAIAAAAEESAAKQAQSAEKAVASQTAMSDAVTKTEASFVSLGATSEEYRANMAIIAAATADAEGGITIMGDAAQSTADVVIASNDRIIASYREVAVAGSGGAGGSAAAQDAAAAGGISKGVGIGSAVVAAGVAVAAGIMVKAAGDFQASMTRLVTSAGESEDNLKQVSAGVLQVARDTGTSTTELAKAMYTIESGGQHGAAGLEVLKAAAQGAKTENADLVTVADAVTSAMTDYHLSASEAANVTSKLVAATGQGKTTFQDLAGAMSAILPKASAAGISLNEILGDLASMTLHGISAQQAAENMADAISHLQSPTQAMSKELAALGLNSTELSQSLGTNGLSGTIQNISQAIQKQMGDGSTAVILNMQNALKGLPKSVQDVSQGVINGTASWRDWNGATKDLTVTQKSQAQAFATLFNGMHTIGTEQMTGAQVMQTYAGAMNKAMGDSAGLNVALMLTGENTQNTTNAIKAVSSATAEAGGNVKGWGDIQQNFNQQMSVLKENVATAGIAIGTALLPSLTAVAKDVSDILGPLTNWIDNNKGLTAGLIITVGGLAAFVAVTWAAQKASSALGNSFTLVTGLAQKFASALGLLDASEGGGALGKIGKELGGLKGAASEAEGGISGIAAGAEEATTAIAGSGGMLAGVAALGTALLTVGGIAAAGFAGWKIGTAIGNNLAGNNEGAVAGGPPVNLNDGGSGYNPAATYSAIAMQTKTATQATGKYIDASNAATKAQAQQVTVAQQVAGAQQAVVTAENNVKTALDKYGANSPQYIKAKQDLQTASDNLVQKLAGEVTGNLTVMSSAKNAGDAEGYMKQQMQQMHDLAPAVQAQLEGVAGKIATIGINSQNDMVPINNLQGGISMLSTSWSGFQNSVQSQNVAVQNILFGTYSTIQQVQGQNDKLNASLQSTVSSINAITNGGKGTGINIKGSLTGGSTGITIKGALAGGTEYASGGLYLTGEEGPELIELPAGSKVTPSPQTQQILDSSAKSVSATGGGGSTGNTTINLSVNIGNYMGSAADQQSVAKQIWQALQNIARQHGTAASLPNIGILPR